MYSKTTSEKINAILLRIPQADLHHVKQLTTPFGIVQHAKFSTPNYHHGFCLDDNCRALLLLTKSVNQPPTQEQRVLISTYLSFLYYMQQDDGSFMNFITFDYQYPEKRGSPDSYGRTMWALGVLLENKHLGEFHAIAKEMFDKAFEHASTLTSLRAIAYTMLGFQAYFPILRENKAKLLVYQKISEFMVQQYQGCARKDWHWFEEIIAYDNAILPSALLGASRCLVSDEMKNIALEAFSFLDKILFRKEQLSIIGNELWYKKDGVIGEYGQQPIEVYSILMLYQRMYTESGLELYLERKHQAFLWFFGENDQKVQLYDPITKGCCDGLEEYGANRNQGAESTLCFWLSYLEIYSSQVSK